MSKRRRQRSSGCSFENHAGRLRLRFRIPGQAGHRARATGLPDMPGNRQRLERLRVLVGAVIRAGQDPSPVLDAHFSPRPRVAVSPPAPDAVSGPTVAAYYERWIAEQAPVVRRAQARDYRRHVVTHVLPSIGQMSLAALRPSDIRGLQAELLTRGLSVKYVKNILSGSFRAMLAQAQVDELLTRDCFVRLKWPKAKRPEPDPLTADERSRVLAWFASHRFGFHPGRGTMEVRRYLHPAYSVYVHTLCWTGMRPSEASGLQWGDVDLRDGRVHVQRSRHLYEYGAPKT